MQKWAYFTMGMMAGVIVLLVHALIMQHHDNVAYARQGGGVSGDGSLVMATGGSQSQIQDIVWVLHEHLPLAALRVETDDEDAKKLRKEKHVSLLMYRCENQAKSLRLIAARDISYDEELIDFNTEKPKVSEIFADLKKAAERMKKDK